jgi:hypothetical protein
MPKGKTVSSSSSTSQETLFPLPILAELCPQFSASPNLSSLSEYIEDYIVALVSHLVDMKAQSKIIRESIVAISGAAGSSASRTTVTTRDACRAIRSFTGLQIPDLTSITRIPQSAQNESIPTQTTPVAAPVELGSLSPSMRGVSDEGVLLAELTRKRAHSAILAAQAELRVPKKRGRPRKHPLPQ